MGFFTTSKEEMDEIYYNVNNPPKLKEERSIKWEFISSEPDNAYIQGYLKSDFSIGFTIYSTYAEIPGFGLNISKNSLTIDSWLGISSDIGELMDIAEKYIKSKGWHVPRYSKQ